MGAPLSGSGSRASTEPCSTVSAASGFDPSRTEIITDLRAWAATYASLGADDEIALLLTAANMLERSQLVAPKSRSKPFRQFKDYGEIDTPAVASALTQAAKEIGEAPVSNLPTYDQLLRCYAAACDALDFAHDEGFEWPHDPFGELAYIFADVDRATWRLEQAWNASAIEARRVETAQTGSIEDESAVGNAETPNPRHPSGDSHA